MKKIWMFMLIAMLMLAVASCKLDRVVEQKNAKDDKEVSLNLEGSKQNEEPKELKQEEGTSESEDNMQTVTDFKEDTEAENENIEKNVTPAEKDTPKEQTVIKDNTQNDESENSTSTDVNSDAEEDKTNDTKDEAAEEVIIQSPPLIVEQLKNIGNSEQVIIVSTTSLNTFKAKIKAFEKVDDKWKEVYSFDGVIGRNGFSSNKVEGDGCSPVGKFSLGTAFGTISKPSGVSMAYKKTSVYDYWIDDASSEDYNKWIYFKGDPDTRWKSYEKLKITPYKYAFVINYNINPIVKGKGSAIFFHIWTSSSKGTAGCTAVSESNMLKLLRWLQPSKNPIIIQGTESIINSMTK